MKVFKHIWAWRPSWSSYTANKLSFPYPTEGNLALIGPAVLEKMIFENGGQMDNGRKTDGSWLYYKLANETKGSGELKITGP